MNSMALSSYYYYSSYSGWISFLLLLIGVIAVVIDYLIAREFYDAAVDKGYTQKKYLWISFFFGIIGYLLVIALPNRRAPYIPNPDVQPFKQARSVSSAQSAQDDELPDL